MRASLPATRPLPTPAVQPRDRDGLPATPPPSVVMSPRLDVDRIPDGGNAADEPVSVSGNGFHVVRRNGVTPKRLPHHRYGIGEIAFLDERVRPDRFQQGLFGQQPAVVLHQHPQRVERLSAERHRAAAARRDDVRRRREGSGLVNGRGDHMDAQKIMPLSSSYDNFREIPDSIQDNVSGGARESRHRRRSHRCLVGHPIKRSIRLPPWPWRRPGKTGLRRDDRPDPHVARRIGRHRGRSGVFGIRPAGGSRSTCRTPATNCTTSGGTPAARVSARIRRIRTWSAAT